MYQTQWKTRESELLPTYYGASEGTKSNSALYCRPTVKQAYNRETRTQEPTRHIRRKRPTQRQMPRGPQPFWLWGLVFWKIIFSIDGVGGWFQDDSNAFHLLCILFLVLLHCDT